MQPVLVIESPVSGLIYVNGKLAGEVSTGRGVSLPVAPQGVVYVEHRPFEAGYLPATRRVTLSLGRPLGDALDDQTGVAAVLWPSHVIDIEITPERYPNAAPPVQETRLGEARLRFIGDAPPRVELYRADTFAAQTLPDGAQPPDVQAIGGLLYLRGSAGGGYYARVFSPEPALLFAVDGREVELSADGAVRALVDANDLVGHARLMTWTPSADGFQLVSSETLWAGGVPNWPSTPQDTALAAAEAIFLGLIDEAEAYFAPNALGSLYAAEEAIRKAGGLTKLKYPLIDGRQAIGMMRLESKNYASVRPVYYHALPMGGTQGTWRLDRFEPEE